MIIGDMFTAVYSPLRQNTKYKIHNKLVKQQKNDSMGHRINMVTNVYVNLNYDRLRIDKALGNFRKSDKKNKNNVRNAWVPFPDPKIGQRKTRKRDGVVVSKYQILSELNTHRRRRRDETVESRRVGGVYTNSQLVGDSFVVSSV